MDSNTLYYSLDLVSGNGLKLTTEQKATLQTSLAILKRNHQFSRVFFWGKIFGIKSDYFIAHGMGDDETNDKKCFYSFNCMDWLLLPPATEALIAEVEVAAKGRFMGDPSHEYKYTETPAHGKGDEAVKEGITVKVNEEKRLAAIVFTIDREVAVVPRGAYIKNHQINHSFRGLNPTEAAKLSNYLHLSEPRNLNKKSILELANLNPFTDIVYPLNEDIPKGMWSLQFEQGNRVCVIRSLLWYGLTFFHVPMTPQHGYVYFGDGLHNLDLPFML